MADTPAQIMGGMVLLIFYFVVVALLLVQSRGEPKAFIYAVLISGGIGFGLRTGYGVLKGFS